MNLFDPLGLKSFLEVAYAVACLGDFQIDQSGEIAGIHEASHFPPPLAENQEFLVSSGAVLEIAAHLDHGIE